MKIKQIKQFIHKIDLFFLNKPPTTTTQMNTQQRQFCLNHIENKFKNHYEMVFKKEMFEEQKNKATSKLCFLPNLLCDYIISELECPTENAEIDDYFDDYFNCDDFIKEIVFKHDIDDIFTQIFIDEEKQKLFQNLNKTKKMEAMSIFLTDLLTK